MFHGSGNSFIPPTPTGVTLTDDLDSQGRMILHMTLPISVPTHARHH